MEQAAVRVVALELDLEGSGKVQRLRSLQQSGLDVVGLMGQVERRRLAELVAVFVLDVLLVFGHQGFLLNIAVVSNRTGRSPSVLVRRHGVCLDRPSRDLVEAGGEGQRIFFTPCAGGA